MAADSGSAGHFTCGALSRILNVGALLLSGEGEIEFANPMACTLLGQPSESALKRNWFSIKPLVLPSATENMAKGNRPVRIALDLPPELGAHRLKAEIYRPNDDSWAGFLILLKDRMSVDILEGTLLQAAQMRQFAGRCRTLAHDMRGPFNAIGISLELLKRSVLANPDAANAKEERYLRVVEEESARLNRMLQDLFSEHAPLAGKIAVFDLREVVHEVASVLEARSAQQKVKFDVRTPYSVISINGFRDRVKQALLNIVSNSLEAMPEGGDIAIGLTTEKSGAILLIEDSGSGISPDIEDEIFEICFNTTKSEKTVDLYAARLVIESHGGDIKVENRTPHGKRFHIVLPVYQPEPTA